MGDRYELSIECPNCHSTIKCYYAESSGIDKTQCGICGKKYKIIMDFKLREIK